MSHCPGSNQDNPRLMDVHNDGHIQHKQNWHFSVFPNLPGHKYGFLLHHNNRDVFSNIHFCLNLANGKYGFGWIIDIEGDVANVKFTKSSQKKIFIKFLKQTS